MIVLDTNVVSETMRRRPSPAVIDFLSRQPSGVFAVTALTLFELRFGMEALQTSEKRLRLQIQIDELAAGVFGPILSLDPQGADHAAAFRAARQKAGRPVGIADALIAGIALRHGAALATRNVRDFDGSNIDLIDPWGDP